MPRCPPQAGHERRDGTRYVIPEGAIFVPQLVIDGVSVPPLNLAALLIGNEPQPAAGSPQSSGGNFAGPVDPLYAAYDLGNLLPYTELLFPADEKEEIIPDLVDREPDVLIVTPDQPAGATAATASGIVKIVDCNRRVVDDADVEGGGSGVSVDVGDRNEETVPERLAKKVVGQRICA